jgi:hypothetical protein
VSPRLSFSCWHNAIGWSIILWPRWPDRLMAAKRERHRRAPAPLRMHMGALRGYLTSVPGGRAYDLEARHCRTWWRRPLTLGGPHDDMDLGLARRSARIIPRRNGECLLEAVSANDIVVDDHSLRKGQRRPLYDGSEFHLGGVGLIYRSQ